MRLRTGLALLRLGERTEAGDMLEHAYRTAHRLGAAYLTDRIRAAVPASGTPRDAGLTPREEQILRLVAQGHTSPEIARQLYLSPRTVEMHVRNGMAKLGCRTRAEAVRRLTER